MERLPCCPGKWKVLVGAALHRPMCSAQGSTGCDRGTQPWTVLLPFRVQQLNFSTVEWWTTIAGAGISLHATSFTGTPEAQSPHSCFSLPRRNTKVSPWKRFLWIVLVHLTWQFYWFSASSTHSPVQHAISLGYGKDKSIQWRIFILTVKVIVDVSEQNNRVWLILNMYCISVFKYF